MKDLAIVIVNWNGGSLLIRCLNSIRISRCSATLDVIVVDNHSVDGSREAAAAAFPEFRVIDSGANLGFGRANNLARSLTGARLVLFLNPDTELTEDTLDKVLECLDGHPEVGALGCRMLYSDGQTQELGLQWQPSPWTVLVEFLLVTGSTRHYLRRWLPTVDPLRSGYVRKLYGGFLLVRRDALDAAGWFDERYFMYAEDADLCRTISGHGWKLYYCSEAEIIHATGGASVSAPSGFSVLMKQESVNRMIAKYNGPVAAAFHRGVVLSGGVLRLGAAMAGRLLALRRPDARSISFWRDSCLKQRYLVLWSLGLRKAAVPVASVPSTPRSTAH